MDWESYLSVKRLRHSEKDGNREGEGDMRTPLESDLGRVIFCSAVRRLHDKTQVFPLTSDDIIHSRLTHSLEVMNIGYSIALNLSNNGEFKNKSGLSSDDIIRQIGSILKTSGIVHDIGNPPFGHYGEDVVKLYFKNLFSLLSHDLQLLQSKDFNFDDKKTDLSFIVKNEIQNHSLDSVVSDLQNLLDNESLRLDYEMFDGNASSFRVLTKLQYLDDLYGLNLTYATLASTLKYPNLGCKIEGKISGKKHGVFSTERDYLNKIASECGMLVKDGEYKRHPLTFLMEAADSICYLTMDIEDAITQKEWFTVNHFIDEVLSQIETEAKAEANGEAEDEDEVEAKANVFYRKLDEIRKQKTARRKKIVSLRNALLSYLVKLATDNFVKNLDKIEKGEYQKELLEDDSELYLAKILSKITKKEILQRKEILGLEITGDSIICGLFDKYIALMFSSDKSCREHAKRLVSKSILCATLNEHLLDKKEQIDIEKEYEDIDVKDLTIEEKLRIIRDYVTCMTDKFALNHYKKLSGQHF